jgi:hypothetical protein
VQVCTVQEEFGSEKRMIQARFRLRTSGYTRLLIAGACLAAITATIIQPVSAGIVTALLGVMALAAWVRGVYRAGQAVHVFDIVAAQLGLIRCDAESAAAAVPGNNAQMGTGVNGRPAPSENGARHLEGNGAMPPARSCEPSPEASL